MSVTTNIGTLSTNCKYISYGVSTAASDAATLLIDITDTLVAMGWSRYDNAGTGVLGETTACTRILRRQTHDFADSGNYQYLGLTISGAGQDPDPNYYNLKFTYAADWTSPELASAYSNPIRLPHGSEGNNWKNAADGPYTPNMLSYTGAGTIWIFNDTYATVFVFTSASQVNNGENVFYFGEYEKSFGEQTPNADTYLHNGVAWNGRELCDFCGSPSFSTPMMAGPQGTTGLSGSYTGIRYALQFGNLGWAVDDFVGSSVYGQPSNWSMSGHHNRCAQISQRGKSGPQFVLTEYPTHTNGVTGRSFGRGIEGMPEAWNNSYTGWGNQRLGTRLHMGWLGWVGHHGPMSYSLSSYGAQYGNAGSNGSDLMVSKAHNTHFFDGTDYTQGTYESWDGWLDGKTLDSNSEAFAIYEPSISVGTTGRMRGNNTSGTANVQSGRYYYTYVTYSYARASAYYSGTAVKFSVFGKMKSVKMTLGLTDNYLGFLDAATIPIDGNGNFSSGGTNTDHWAIPLNDAANIVLWMKK